MVYEVWSKKTTGCEYKGPSLEFALSEGQRVAKETKKEVLVESWDFEKRKRIALFFGHNF